MMQPLFQSDRSQPHRTSLRMETKTLKMKAIPSACPGRWRLDAEEKHRRLAETEVVGQSISSVARRNQLSQSILTTESLTDELMRDLMAETLKVHFGASCKHPPHPIEWITDNEPLTPPPRRANSGPEWDCASTPRAPKPRSSTAWPRHS